MQEFAIEKCGDFVSSFSKKKGGFSTSMKEGQNFFVISWKKSDHYFQLIGFCHPSIPVEPSKIRKFAESFSAARAATLSDKDLRTFTLVTPGWSLAHVAPDSIRVWRDPVGRLPIFWNIERQTLQWTSRPSMLDGFSSAVDRDRLWDFLARSNDLGRQEFWEGVNRLCAGEVLTFESEKEPTFQSWWPPPGNQAYSDSALDIKAGILQRSGDLLAEAVQSSIESGACVLSLSGGIDSPLLLVFLENAGWAGNSISMVDATTEMFDERREISAILSAWSGTGEYVEIGGRMAWDRPELHHPIHDFGPTAYAAASYYQPFLAQLKNRFPKILTGRLVSGLGADQLFSCSPGDFARDRLWERAWPGSRGSKIRWRSIIKDRARRTGIRHLPGRSSERYQPSWLQQRTAPKNLQLHPVYDRNDWLSRRANQFKSWKWENSMRLIERYRRTTGILIDYPYLALQLCEFAFGLPPVLLRTSSTNKVILRDLLRGNVPNRIADRPKRGLFDEVVWRGISSFLLPSLGKQFDFPALSSSGIVISNELRKFGRALANTPDIIGRQHGHEFWRAIAAELWLRADG